MTDSELKEAVVTMATVLSDERRSTDLADKSAGEWRKKCEIATAFVGAIELALLNERDTDHERVTRALELCTNFYSGATID
jgi:hypothetical protein